MLSFITPNFVFYRHLFLQNNFGFRESKSKTNDVVTGCTGAAQPIWSGQTGAWAGHVAPAAVSGRTCGGLRLAGQCASPQGRTRTRSPGGGALCTGHSAAGTGAVRSLLCFESTIH